jgi:REP element-mobilizing transposase RayT
MVKGYHAIWSCYGFWLPNDPRGSWSNEVWAPHLRAFGEATKTDERRSLADKPHDARARREAKEHLLYPAVRFDGLQARAVARGFGAILPKIRVCAFACAIMPDHVHIVIDRNPEWLIEDIVAYLKRSATRQLNREGIHPLRDFHRNTGRVPPPWVEGGWFRYLNDDIAIESAIDYVRKNPIRIGLPPQRWRFVTPFRRASQA